ncbi:hypothetical protein JTE90_013441 [Oedothorax gibbosus]|uniref:DDE Tnp4 domain-containing protein n=1 Tax=Oedothorax gibbosus TaxID=931172 RepID=A0AAV6TYI0_9ARAC|nr:hypothetical protein JTE90_003439 [Oedothorax gibbosus]KAG8197313.1 hypothetical protein JTE90_013441 [Oedothorax gibbosus]
MNREYITFPSTAEDCRKVAEGFFKIAQFPGVIGAMDCTHVRIASPGGDDAERFRNRKNFFSINVQTIISADLVIENVVARWPGSAHDSTIFNNSSAVARLQSSTVLRKHHLIGDSGYANQPCLLTPLLNPSTPAEERYNKSHILTRNTVERKYGILKRRFPCLRLGLNCHLKNVPAIIVACCVLHNLAVKFNDAEPPEDAEVAELLRQLATGETASYVIRDNGSQGTAAGEARRRLIIEQYFS